MDLPTNATVAQLVEHLIEVQGVEGSIPSSCANLTNRVWLNLVERCIWIAEAAGSNPATLTNLILSEA
tara:strand:+ start:6624 stop:6827 length:204 start_codon:yes stop_codon:yes gene_type:complete